MKVSLVVASGAHQGKVIPVVGTQFVIGRDPQCHLRPASQAVSKQHCAIVISDGVVTLKDFGSTNGSILNDTLVKGEERELKNNDSVKVGPLDFTIRIEMSAMPADGTPLPDMNPEATAALAAVKAATSSAATATSTRNATPAPKPPARPNPATKPGTKESPALKSGSKESPALKSGSKESPALEPSSPPQDGGHDENDRLAAMLLGLDDEEVPGGSTVVDMPIVDLLKEAEAKAAAEKKPVTKEDSSNAASELLRKYMRRPK
jgi:predicted component of type VI protein secretion system